MSEEAIESWPPDLSQGGHRRMRGRILKGEKKTLGHQELRGLFIEFYEDNPYHDMVLGTLGEVGLAGMSRHQVGPRPFNIGQARGGG